MTTDAARPRRRTRTLAHAAGLLLAVMLTGPAVPLGGLPQVEGAPKTQAPGAVGHRHQPPPAMDRTAHTPAAVGTGGIPPANPSANPPATPPGQRAFKPPWSWPLDPEPRVTRYFLPPPEPWKAGHRGVDLAVGPAGEILSPADGTVTFVGMVAGRPVLSIGHEGGLLGSFEPVQSALGEGARVRRGQVVGTIAGPPHCPFSCVHWGVRRDGVYVNPLAYVTDRRPSVLLPLRDG